MGTVFPKSIRKGDRVCVIDPANAFTEEGIREVKELFGRQGLEVVISEDMAFRRGTPRERAALLNQVIRDERNRGIFCMWGGYGTMTLLEYLDYAALEENRPVFTGFSDITAMHIAIGRKTELVTFHSASLYSPKRPSTPQAKELLIDTLFHPQAQRAFENLNKEPLMSLNPGCCEGKIAGGNLTLVCRLMGTPWEIDTRDKILFLEEVGERPYRLHGMLTQLKMAGKLDQAAGIVIGSLEDCDTPGKPGSALQLVKEAVEGVKCPVICGLRAGHIPDALTIPMNRRARIEAAGNHICFQTCP